MDQRSYNAADRIRQHAELLIEKYHTSKNIAVICDIICALARGIKDAETKEDTQKTP